MFFNDDIEKVLFCIFLGDSFLEWVFLFKVCIFRVIFFIDFLFVFLIIGMIRLLGVLIVIFMLMYFLKIKWVLFGFNELLKWGNFWRFLV